MKQKSTISLNYQCNAFTPQRFFPPSVNEYGEEKEQIWEQFTGTTTERAVTFMLWATDELMVY